MASFEYVPEGGQIDFQVRAKVGYSFAYYGDHVPIRPNGTIFQSIEESVWGDTQTITLGELQAPSPEPTIPTSSTPFPTNCTGAILAETEAILGLAIIVATVVAGLGLLIHLVRRK